MLAKTGNTAPSLYMLTRSLPYFNFTRSIKKIILTKDVEHLGFAGEICFVKPGYALNYLVPNRKALFWTDPKVQRYIASVDVSIYTFPSNLCLYLVRGIGKEAEHAQPANLPRQVEGDEASLRT